MAGNVTLTLLEITECTGHSSCRTILRRDLSEQIGITHESRFSHASRWIPVFAGMTAMDRHAF
jgi:hypothetical protein